MSAGMASRATVVVLASLLATVACKKKTELAGTRAINSFTVRDESGEIEVRTGYKPAGAQIVEFVVEMKNLGITEMDKIVIDIELNGFVVYDGNNSWTGFVPPRQTQRHSVTIKTLEGGEYPSVTVTVRRSVDSHLLHQTEIPFSVVGGTLKPDKS